MTINYTFKVIPANKTIYFDWENQPISHFLLQNPFVKPHRHENEVGEANLCSIKHYTLAVW